MKIAIRTAAAIRQARIVALPHPSGLPRIRAKMKRKSDAEKVTSPGMSSGSGSLPKTLRTFCSVSTIATTPIGTLTKKIHSQPKFSVITPPISGPIATAPPTVAPQTPKAVARSLPWNSCPISASEVANMPAPPTPCRPRQRLSRVASSLIPQRNEATVKIAKPIVKTRRRPSRSPRLPAVSRNEASISE